jgi:hypothetical protein
MAYNPITEVWTQKADMPTARCSLSACVLDGKIYAIGGATEDWRVFSYKHVEVYDPSTDTWTRESDMPTQRWGLGTCVVDGKIYAIGGGLGSDPITANEVYVPITDTWTTKSPMQQKRFGLFVGSIGDKIYAIGGSYPVPGPTILSTVEEYDTGVIVTPPLPDFNGDGLVDIKDLLRLIQSWGQDDSTVDIAPPPFGDGIVDALDLELLMSCWGQEVDDPTLIAHWPLDEAQGGITYDSAADCDGTLIGGPVWQPNGGMVAGALQFDGIDDCVSTDFVLNPAEGKFSVFAWIKGGAPGQVVLSQADGVNWLRTDSVDGCLMTQHKSGRTSAPLLSQSSIIDGEWHRITFVWDGSYRYLYVDGVEVATDVEPLSGLESAEGGLYFGVGSTLAPGTFFSGLIDDVRIYNRVVSP